MIATLDQSQQLSPGAWIPPGVLEAGQSYYWKVRGSRTITGAAIHSLWSPVMFFSVKPGFAVRSSVSGPQLLTPIDGICQDCQPAVGFSWTPIKNAKKYEFTLAYDQDLKNVIVQAVTTTTAYKYEDRLEPGRIYFWQVKAVAPFESDPSPTGTFVIAGSRPVIPLGVPAPILLVDSCNHRHGRHTGFDHRHILLQLYAQVLNRICPIFSGGFKLWIQRNPLLHLLHR